MNVPDSAREALFIEALGGLAELIDQLRVIGPAVEESRQALVDAHAGLATQLANRLSSFAVQMCAMEETARTKTVKTVLTNVVAGAREAMESQNQDLRETAQALFAEQARLAIERLTATSQRMVEQQRSLWDQWLVLVLTACASSLLTLAVLWPLAAWTGGWRP